MENGEIGKDHPFGVTITNLKRYLTSKLEVMNRLLIIFIVAINGSQAKQGIAEAPSVFNAFCNGQRFAEDGARSFMFPLNIHNPTQAGERHVQLLREGNTPAN